VLSRCGGADVLFGDEEVGVGIDVHLAFLSSMSTLVGKEGAAHQADAYFVKNRGVTGRHASSSKSPCDLRHFDVQVNSAHGDAP
jgi:hypothetical protein